MRLPLVSQILVVLLCQAAVESTGNFNQSTGVFITGKPWLSLLALPIIALVFFLAI